MIFIPFKVDQDNNKGLELNLVIDKSIFKLEAITKVEITYIDIFQSRIFRILLEVGA